jgi:F-type H+-transporting ATPase subunit b
MSLTSLVAHQVL